MCGVSKEERGIGMVLAGWFSAGVLLLLEGVKVIRAKEVVIDHLAPTKLTTTQTFMWVGHEELADNLFRPAAQLRGVREAIVHDLFVDAHSIRVVERRVAFKGRRREGGRDVSGCLGCGCAACEAICYDAACAPTRDHLEE